MQKLLITITSVLSFSVFATPAQLTTLSLVENHEVFIVDSIFNNCLKTNSRSCSHNQLHNWTKASFKSESSRAYLMSRFDQLTASLNFEKTVNESADMKRRFIILNRLVNEELSIEGKY